MVGWVGGLMDERLLVQPLVGWWVLDRFPVGLSTVGVVGPKCT